MTTNITTAATTELIKDNRSRPFKLHVNNKDILRGIQIVQSAISSRNTLPVLGNILFQADDRLRLSATDLEVGIRTWVKADILEKGAITIPAKILLDFLRTIEGDREISLEVSDNNKVTVRSGRDRLNVTGLPKTDYPVLPDFDEKKAVEIPVATLKEIVKKTMFAASTDETRYVLNGIHIIIDGGKATAVATDGRRLAYIERPLVDKDLQAKVIIPSKTIQELLRMMSDETSNTQTLRVIFTDNQISFFDGETVILSRLIEGHFPNYDQVIPKTHDIQLTLNRQELLAAATRAAVGTMERGGAIKVSLSKGLMKIQAASQGRVEVEAEIVVAYEGADFNIALNPVYLADVLKALDQNEVLLELSSPLSPGVIRPQSGDDSYRYIMMPMKL